MLFQNILSFLSFPVVPQAGLGSDGVRQVAVIGAGAAGSSAAYHLQKYANESGIALNVAVFEKTAHIGGRTITVNVYDDPAEAMELGASIFVDVNHILSNATRDFGLTVKTPGPDGEGVLGIWDGDSFVYKQDSRSWDWVNLVKLFWKYGTAPYYTRKLVQNTIATFLKLYEEPFFPFRSLSDRVFQLDLVKITGVTGKQFLEANKLNGAFAHHIVQASTRVNYASNLEFIHGLGTMVSLAPEGAKAIEGGNWQIFANMVKASQANLHLNTAVTNIALLSGSDRKYKITTASTTETSEPELQREKGKKAPSHHPVLFDDVIIATPFQYANISTGAADLLPEPIDMIPYATLHVTLFASPYKFSPAFFKLPPGSEVPDSVLTTLGADEEAKPGRSGAGKVGFYSATLQRVVINPRTRNSEYVYKIFSPEAVTSGFLSELLGVEITNSSLTRFRPQPQSQSLVKSESESRSDGAGAGAGAEVEDVGVTDDQDASNQNGRDDDSVVEPISWYHGAVFHPYPQKQPRITFQDPVLRDGLYYTSGIESFISTMETSALMGMNVARLIVDGYAGITRSHNQTVESSVPTTPKPEEEQQNVLVQQEAAEDRNRSVDQAGEL